MIEFIDKIVFQIVKVIVFCIYCLLLVLEVPLRARKKTRKFVRKHVIIARQQELSPLEFAE